MILQIAVPLLTIVVAVVVAWLVPAVGMRYLWPSLEKGGRPVVNYRGAEVSPGLGVVWLLWAVSVGATGAAVRMKTGLWEAVSGGSIADSRLYLALASSRMQSLDVMLPLLLVVGAYAFGALDDGYGDSAAKGFGGHLSALRQGRLTTGGAKMLGIGLLALYAGSRVAGTRVPALAGQALPAPFSAIESLVAWLAAALVIALTANLVNLLDLRPGRALKGYSALVVLAVVISTISLALSGLAGGFRDLGVFPVPTGPGSAPMVVFGAVMVGATLLVLALGPVLAVWRYDLGERGMLGDAGANAAGALAGYMLAAALPVWWLLAAALLLLAANLASERFSFSEIIEGNGVLRRLDELGRTRTDSIDTGKDG